MHQRFALPVLAAMISTATIATATITVGTTTEAHAQDASPPPSVPDEVASLIVDQTLLVTAGTEDSMRITATPGTGGGRSIRCSWFGVAVGSTGDVNLFQVGDPVIDKTYLLWCWYLPELESLAGHPVPVTYTGPGVPGEPADDDELSEFALASMEFVTPTTVLNPDTAQIVGIKSWLAIDGQLDYAPIHANAGPVWVSVWPQFRDVVWDLGNGDTVRCAGDTAATTVWHAHLDAQTSDCTYTYERAGPTDDDFTIFATATWTILRRTFEHSNWLPWRDFSLTTSRPIRVAELQAVIN